MSYVPPRIGDGGDYTSPRHDWPVGRGTKMLYGKATGGDLLRVVCSPRSPGHQKGSGSPEEVVFD